MICLSPRKFDSSFIVDETCCRALLPDEDSADLCGLLIPICTALYVIRQIRAPKPGYVGRCLRSIESNIDRLQRVLISAFGDNERGLTHALVRICQHNGLEV